MKFRTWLEAEASLNAGFPELYPPNRGTSTPASDAVIRTGLQPQVNSHEIRTDAKDEQDKLQAIDSMLQRVNQDLPQSESEKVSGFKKLWKKLMAKWEDLKMKQASVPDEVETNGLGSFKGDEKLIQYMQNNPNAILTGPNQMPTGPGLT